MSTADAQGPYCPLLYDFSTDDFAERYPEFAPLAPVAEEVRLVYRGESGPAEFRARAEEMKGIALSEDDVRTSPESSLKLAGLYEYATHQLEDAVQRLEQFGLRVSPVFGRVTIPVEGRGRNPDLLTLAAGLVWESLDVESYRHRTGDLDDVPTALAWRVDHRLAHGLHWRFEQPRDVGRNSRLRRALRRYDDDPHRYQRLVERFGSDGAGAA